MFHSIMTVINYPRHFAFLPFGALAVFVVLRLHNESIFLISNGFLHAAAVVCALRGAATWLRRALFAAIARADRARVRDRAPGPSDRYEPVAHAPE